MQKLLVAYNFSKKSDLALEFALTYCQHMEAEVYLLHVFVGTMTDFRRLDKLNEEYLERMKQVVIMATNKLSEQGVLKKSIDVHRRVSTGKPGDEILKVAAGINADMILIGTPGSSQFKRLLFKTPCTMVLVREKDPAFVV